MFINSLVLKLINTLPNVKLSRQHYNKHIVRNNNLNSTELFLVTLR